MSLSEQQFLERLVAEAEDTVGLLSNARKRERERLVCAAFLRCAGIPFQPSELQCPQTDPPDVRFSNLAFEVKMLLGGRHVHGEWKKIASRRRGAKRLRCLLEPSPARTPLSIEETADLVRAELESQSYDGATKAKLDALIYVNLRARFLDPSGLARPRALDQLGWRSISFVFPPYAMVLSAAPNAPVVLRDLVGIVRSSCQNPDEWFNL